jgi:hypothetical protein
VRAGACCRDPRPRFGPDWELWRPVEREDRLRVGVGQVVSDLSSLQQDVERHHGRAGLQDPVVDHRELRHVGAHQRDLVARFDPDGPEQVRDLVGRRVELREGETRLTGDDRDAVRVLGVRDSEFAEALRPHTVDQFTAPLMEVLRRAAVRGQISATALTHRVMMVGPDLLLAHAFINGPAIPDAAVVEIVDLALLPLLRDYSAPPA